MSSTRSSDRDYYDVLGADVGASSRELELLYKRQASRCHPDKGGTEEEMKALNEAYGVLRNRDSRRAYDAKRRLERLKTAPPLAAPAAQDIGAFGHFLSAFLCLLVGFSLLLLVRFQWIWFLWPLAILAVFVILFGVALARSALRASLSINNPLQRHQLLRETVFWTAVLCAGFGVYFLITILG